MNYYGSLESWRTVKSRHPLFIYAVCSEYMSCWDSCFHLQPHRCSCSSFSLYFWRWKQWKVLQEMKFTGFLVDMIRNDKIWRRDLRFQEIIWNFLRIPSFVAMGLCWIYVAMGLLGKESIKMLSFFVLKL